MIIFFEFRYGVMEMGRNIYNYYGSFLQDETKYYPKK